MQSTFSGPKIALSDKKTEVSLKTPSFQIQSKNHAKNVNISTKLNGFGGSRFIFDAPSLRTF